MCDARLLHIENLKYSQNVKGLSGLWAEDVYLSRIRPLPLSEAKVGVITNWSQSGLQSPTEINAPRGCAEICI